MFQILVALQGIRKSFKIYTQPAGRVLESFVSEAMIAVGERDMPTWTNFVSLQLVSDGFFNDDSTLQRGD